MPVLLLLGIGLGFARIAHAQDCTYAPIRGPGYLAAYSGEAALHRFDLIREPDRGPVGFRTPRREGATGAGTACGSGSRFESALVLGADAREGARAFVAGGARSAPLADRTRLALGLGARFVPSDRLAVTAGFRTPGSALRESGEGMLPAHTSTGELQELALAAEAGPFHGWIGRRAPGYGMSATGGIVLSGAVPIDAIGIGSRAPGRLPGRAASSGEWSFEGLMGRMSDQGEIGRPWFLAGRGVWAPGGGFEAGFTRGAFFGGEGAPGLTLSRWISLLFGAHHRENGQVVQMTNQVASFDLSWRGGVGIGGSTVPAFAYTELGFEDSSGAWKRSPALTTGVEAVHPDRRLSLGIERQYFSGRNGHGLWYRHSFYREGWSDQGRPLGHPLAGAGTEWLLHANWFASDAPPLDGYLRAGVRLRDRSRDHSFAPDLEGGSRGGFVQVAWPLTGRGLRSLRAPRGGTGSDAAPGAGAGEAPRATVELLLSAEAETLDAGPTLSRVHAGLRWVPGWPGRGSPHGGPSGVHR